MGITAGEADSDSRDSGVRRALGLGGGGDHRGALSPARAPSTLLAGGPRRRGEARGGRDSAGETGGSFREPL